MSATKSFNTASPSCFSITASTELVMLLLIKLSIASAINIASLSDTLFISMFSILDIRSIFFSVKATFSPVIGLILNIRMSFIIADIVSIRLDKNVSISPS